MQALIVLAFLTLSMFNIHFSFAEPRYIPECCCYKPSCGASYDLDGPWPAAELHKCWAKLNMYIDFAVITKRGNEIDFLALYRKYGELFSKYLKEKTSLTESYSGKYIKQRELSHYYPSIFEERYEYLKKVYKIMHRWEIASRTFVYDNKVCNPSGYCPNKTHKGYKKDIENIKKEFDKLKATRKNINIETDELQRKIFEFCSNRHTCLRSYYEHGFLEFRRGNYITAMNISKKLVEYSLKYDDHEFLTADTFLRLGITCSMSLEYAQSIEALTQAIEKDPANTEAYVQRAIAYFELGDFEAAISDYIRSGNDRSFELSNDPYKVKFGKGFMKGACGGLWAGANEIPASLWHTIRGTGQLLWAGVQDPIGVSKDMINSVEEIIDFLSKQDASTLSQIMAPEVYELVTKWKKLDAYARGEKAGFVLGKYGINILACYGSIKAVKLVKDLRQANALSNLKTLTASKQAKQELIIAANQAAVQREQFFKTVCIHADKQGKHIKGHKNFTQKNNDLLPSIFTHPDPEALLKKYAGTGKPHGQFNPGKVGFKEVIECDEIIGEWFNPDTKKYMPTKRATIHYDKNGSAHFVPSIPEPL